MLNKSNGYGVKAREPSLSFVRIYIYIYRFNGSHSGICRDSGWAVGFQNFSKQENAVIIPIQNPAKKIRQLY